MTRPGFMTGKRFALVCVAAFLVWQVLQILIHGFLLAGDYAPFYGTLLRPMSRDAWQPILLPVSHLSFIIALVWVYDRIADGSSSLGQGVRLGVLAFTIDQAPLWLLWYAEQPWPGVLAIKQLTLELAAAVVLGLLVARLAGRPSANRSA